MWVISGNDYLLGFIQYQAELITLENNRWVGGGIIAAKFHGDSWVGGDDDIC